MVEFEWDEDKRLSNIEKHGLDFEDADQFVDGRPVFTTSNLRGNEKRYVTSAQIEHRFLTLAWTMRDEKIRVISMRRARNAEERAHRTLHG